MTWAEDWRRAGRARWAAAAGRHRPYLVPATVAVVAVVVVAVFWNLRRELAGTSSRAQDSR